MIYIYNEYKNIKKTLDNNIRHHNDIELLGKYYCKINNK